MARRGSYFGKVQEDPTQVPPSLSSTYFGSNFSKVPKAILKVVPLLHSDNKCPQDVVRGCLQGVVRYMRDGAVFDDGQQGEDAYKKFQSGLMNMSGGEMSTQDVNLLFTGLYEMMHRAVSTKSDSTIVTTHLKQMNVPQQIAEDIGQALMKSRLGLEKVAIHKKEGFPRLASFRYRVDVAISSGSLSRVMVPSLLFQMTLSNGKIHTFNVSIQEFNQLRYGVAKTLRDMGVLERHPVMRVENEEERKRQLEQQQGGEVKPSRRSSQTN